MMLCMENDPTQRMVWIATDKHLFQILKKDEDRDVWKLYLEKALGETESAAMAGSRFETALQHCKVRRRVGWSPVPIVLWLTLGGCRDGGGRWPLRPRSRRTRCLWHKLTTCSHTENTTLRPQSTHARRGRSRRWRSSSSTSRTARR